MKKIIIVFVICLISMPAYAISGLSVGIKGGMATNVDLPKVISDGPEFDKLKLFGVQARVTTLPVLDFIFTAEYGWDNLDLSDYDSEIKFHDLFVSASAVYPYKKFTLIEPYIGGGIDNHQFSFSYEYTGAPSPEIAIPVDDTYFGYHFMAGVDLNLPAFPFGLTGEFRANWIDTGNRTRKFNSLTLGINYNFP